MADIRRFDHIGITVSDLAAATTFFESLGMEIEGRAVIEGDFIDTVLGMSGARSEMVMLRPPDDGTRLELSTFLRPDPLPVEPPGPVNALGLRNIAFEVHDLRAVVARLAAQGYGLVGGIGEYEDAWLMAYVSGPEGIIVSLAQPIG